MDYGFIITQKGKALIAKLTAGATLSLSRVIVGSGCVNDTSELAGLNNLVTPVALATSSTPIYNGSTVKMVVEYRADLHGGLTEGFWLNEFGIFAIDPDEGEILLYYGTLGEHPQWVNPLSDTGLDIRRFPVAIVIGESAGVEVSYSCDSFMTADEVSDYCDTKFMALNAELSTSLAAMQSEIDTAVAEMEDAVVDAIEDMQETVGAAVIDVTEHPNDTTKHISASERTTWNNKSDKSVSINAVLTASGWNGADSPYVQVLIIQELTANQNGYIGLAYSATAEQREVARAAMLSIVNQASGGLAIAADGEKPTVDLPVTIVLL